MFIMLTAAFTTEMIRSRGHKRLFMYILILNGLVFLGGVAFFIRDHSPLAIIIGMCFSVGVLVMTFYRYTDFERSE
jgi:O-antigen/teichoic acid export membrane protein